MRIHTMSLTNEQKEKRRKGIGSTELIAIAGKSKWASPLDIYFLKMGVTEPTDISDVPAVYWGTTLEAVVANEYAKRTGKTLEETDETFVHKEYPFIVSHIDRKIVGENAVLECKTATLHNAHKWGPEGSEIVPSEYWLQVAHQACVLDLDYVDISVLIGGQDFRTYRYRRNLKLEEKIIEICKRFWLDHVEKGVPPSPQSTSDILKLFPRPTNEEAKIIDEESRYTIDKLKEIREKIKNLQEEEEKHKTQICSKIADSFSIMDTDGKTILATYREIVSNRLDTLLMKAESPDIYKKYSKETTTRTLRIR